MQSSTKYIYFFILVCLIILTPVGLSQGAVPAAETEADELSFPYIAEITGDNVNIRSGPGTNYYHCGQLDTGDRVKVVARKYSWSHIVPPAGSFSWISKQYVSAEPNNPDVGMVTGDSVRVYAGSNFLKPMHSTTVQLELNKDDKVKLMGVEMDDYYKIVPPSGAYLWVLTQYTRPIGAVGEVEIIAQPKAEEAEPEAEVEASTPAVVPTTISDESGKLKGYYALAGLIEIEHGKPINQQNYTEIKEVLADLASDKEAGKAARYAAFAIKKIERYELASAVDKEVQLQDAQLQNIYAQIEEAHAAELAQVPELGGFAAVGQFQTSEIYGPVKHYRILDDSGQTICYALPEGPVSEVHLSKFVGRKVGLTGTVEPHPQTKGALVRFTEITELE